MELGLGRTSPAIWIQQASSPRLATPPERRGECREWKGISEFTFARLTFGTDGNEHILAAAQARGRDWTLKPPQPLRFNNRQRLVWPPHLGGGENSGNGKAYQNSRLSVCPSVLTGTTSVAVNASSKRQHLPGQLDPISLRTSFGQPS